MLCKVPPSGWYCTRRGGHEGPCAAVQLAAGKEFAQGDKNTDWVRSELIWTISSDLSEIKQGDTVNFYGMFQVTKSLTSDWHVCFDVHICGVSGTAKNLTDIEAASFIHGVIIGQRIILNGK